MIASVAYAEGTYQPPRTGLESPDEAIRSRVQRQQPMIGAFQDAYGNPIYNQRPEVKERKRLPAGAYGGYGKKQERPLPDAPNAADNEPLW